MLSGEIALKNNHYYYAWHEISGQKDDKCRCWILKEQVVSWQNLIASVGVGMY